MAAVGIYNVALLAVIFGSLLGGGVIAGVVVLAYQREDKNRPFLPWSPRKRVEQARAHTEILEQHLQQEAIEVKRAALSFQRQKVMQAIEDDDFDMVQQLGLPRGSLD